VVIKLKRRGRRERKWRMEKRYSKQESGEKRKQENEEKIKSRCEALAYRRLTLSVLPW
jgi:hypothetical protein